MATNKNNYRHGMYGTTTYKSWAEMKQRCNTVGKKYWHDKGISYQKSWESFVNFWEDMGTKPKNTSLDRIDNNRDYCKENCRWATYKQQTLNRGVTRLFNGKTLSDWSKVLGIKRSTLAQRYYVYGWSVERVLSK